MDQAYIFFEEQPSSGMYYTGINTLNYLMIVIQLCDREYIIHIPCFGGNLIIKFTYHDRWFPAPQETL